MENTDTKASKTRKPEDHLHIRGEYSMILTCRTPETGSPPHTWRILWICDIINRNFRITSTYVENTVRLIKPGAFPEDHLHIRGEYHLACPFHCSSPGSPPHTWRIQTLISAGTDQTRITSTYVENTLTMEKTVDLERDHLHIRGEYLYLT